MSTVPFFHLIADVENILATHTDRQQREQTRCQFINKTQNFINKTAPMINSPLEKFCAQATIITTKFIKSNPDILITQADKGNRTVIMNTTDYENKMIELIGDTSIYQPINADPTDRYQRMNNNIVRRLYALKLIDTRTKHKLTSYNAVCPRIYGQPKAHKPNLPLRPVVPNTTAPTYHLCKYLADILQRSLTSQYNVADSKSFCQYVNNLSIPADHMLVSFDAVSLFTNVTKDVVTHDIIMMWGDIKENTDISLDLFLEIIEFCIEASFFCFRGKHFRQTSGTAMGSPLSPILADIVMENLVTRAIKQAKVPVEYIRKYVDDLFLVLHKDQVEKTLAIFNEQNPRITFTCETEDSGKLPYLDLLVVRYDDGSVKTDWYAKPISSGRILNYFSFHSVDQKLAVVHNFVDRVRSLSTIKTEAEKNEVIYSQLRKNDYPYALISRMLRQPTDVRQTEKPTSYRSIPYINGLTPTIKKILQNGNTAMGISYSNKNTVGQLYKTAKDPVPNHDKNNVVYQIACRDCHCKYIGMTSNKLRCRMYGHQTHVNKLENLLANGSQYEDYDVQELRGKTAMMDHCIRYKHRFNINNPTIIDITYKPQALPVLEMCQIATTSNTVNHRTDTDNLSCAYANLLDSIKRRREESNTSTTTRRNTQTNPNHNPTQLTQTQPTQPSPP